MLTPRFTYPNDDGFVVPRDKRSIQAMTDDELVDAYYRVGRERYACMSDGDRVGRLHLDAPMSMIALDLTRRANMARRRPSAKNARRAARMEFVRGTVWSGWDRVDEQERHARDWYADN